MARGEHPRHPFADGVALGDDRLRERPASRGAPEEVQLVFGEKTRRREQIGDQLGVHVYALESTRRSAADGGSFALLFGRAGGALRVHASIPQMRYRRHGTKP